MDRTCYFTGTSSRSIRWYSDQRDHLCDRKWPDRSAGQSHCRSLSFRKQRGCNEPSAFLLLLGIGWRYFAFHHLFAVFGIENWHILACIWALIPLYNTFNFLSCPIESLTEEGQGLGIRQLCRIPIFWITLVLMVCAGASEISMAQWASAYVESALGISKSIGDVAGPCLFAIMMGISRSFYGKYGEKMDLMKFMIASGALCLVCYLLSALAPLPALNLLGCVVCGFSVGIMWPGTISIASGKIPLGGTAMFALLAMAGDLGGSVGPGIVGFVTQRANDDLKAGMLAGSIFPVILVLSVLLLRKKRAEGK